MKLQYVGCKPFEDAFKSETGVTWAPGVSHEIADPAIAARMLKHPDVFAAADEAKAPAQAPAQDPAPAPEPAKEPEQITEAPQADETGNVPNAEDQPKAEFIMKTENGPLALDALDKDTLKQLAKEAGISVGNSGADKIRAKLVEAFPVTEAE
jgi:hypothetical protein